MGQHAKLNSLLYTCTLGLFKRAMCLFSLTVFFTQNIFGAEINSSSAKKICTQDITALSKQFNQIIRPRHKILFHKSMRSKKYESTAKDLKAFKEYIENKKLDDQQPQECDSIFHYLHDKILWIDDFHGGPLEYFSSPYYASRFFKENKDIFHIEIEPKKRKENF
jgi:hypothetical protein